MPLPALVLWLLVFPAAMVVGLVAALVTYFLSRPRVDDGEPGIAGVRRDVLIESWRLVAMVAAIPAAILAMELALWGGFFEHRVSLAFTGLAQWLGLVLLAVAPIPVVAATIRRKPLRGAPLRRTIIACAAGLALFPLGWLARSAAWTAVATAAASGGPALDDVLILKQYGFITESEVRLVLARALDSTPDVLARVAAAEDPDDVGFDADVAGYFADRLDRALAAAEPAVTTEPGLAAVPAMWSLTGDRARTLRAYAMSVPELRGRALAHAGPPTAEIVTDALWRGTPAVALAVLLAAEPELGRSPLDAGLISALAARSNRPGPVAPVASRILLRDASEAALRPILARFAVATDPAWALVRAECPARTPSLKALTTDADPEIAAGAQAVLAYVRQYCFTTRRLGQ